MNKAQYRDLFRRTMRDDIIGPQLFNDDEIDAFVQEARVQAAVRDRLCLLSHRAVAPNPAVIPVIGGVYEYDLARSIFRINRLTVNNLPIKASTKHDFDFYRVEQGNRVGTPLLFYVDEDRKLVFDKMPDIAGGLEIRIDGYKKPDMLVLDTDVDLEIPDLSTQTNLMYHAYSRGYMIQDSEVEQIQKSQFFEGEFNRMFGMPITEDALRKQFLYRERTVGYGGIGPNHSYRTTRGYR